MYKNINILYCGLMFLLIYFSSIEINSQIINSSGNISVSDVDSAVTRYGALAIDRNNGSYFGWASDCLTLAEAEKMAIEACNNKGGDCTIVLSFSGTGCAAYHHITGNVGLGYGWGLGKTKEEADAKAKKECAERSFGLPAPHNFFKCNSPNSGELKEIYDAHDEINRLIPGIITDY